MKNLISFRRATSVTIALFALLIVAHFGLLMAMLVFGVTPIDYLWGGRLETREQLFMFEAVALVVQLGCLILVLMKARYIDIPAMRPVASIGMWVLVVLFALNTLGNLTAATAFEKSLSILTAVLVILTLRLAVERTATQQGSR